MSLDSCSVALFGSAEKAELFVPPHATKVVVVASKTGTLSGIDLKELEASVSTMVSGLDIKDVVSAASASGVDMKELVSSVSALADSDDRIYLELCYESFFGRSQTDTEETEDISSKKDTEDTSNNNEATSNKKDTEDISKKATEDSSSSKASGDSSSKKDTEDTSPKKWCDGSSSDDTSYQESTYRSFFGREHCCRLFADTV